MSGPLDDLLMDCHRAESNAVVTYGFRGTITHVGDQNTEIIDTPEEGAIHNIGVSKGITAMLDQLADAGYTITDRLGRKVTSGQFHSFEVAYNRWHHVIKPNLKLVK